MNIDKRTLIAQYERAKKQWPFIHPTEGRFHLPDGLLFADGSRETNLTNEVGDGGHGHGVFQLDDRSHTIPAGFDKNVQTQASTAAAMLAGLIAQAERDGFGQRSLHVAVSAYNCGYGNATAGERNHGDSDHWTTGGDYASDVLGRLAVIHGQHIKDDHPKGTK